MTPNPTIRVLTETRKKYNGRLIGPWTSLSDKSCMYSQASIAMLSRLRLLIDFPQCTEPFSSLPYYQFMCLYEPTALTFLLLYAFAMCSSFFLFSLFKKAYSILKRLKDKILLRSLFPSVVSISLLVYDSGRVFVSTPKTFIIDFFKILSASSYISS